MQTLTERVFEVAPPVGIFDTTVVRNLFPEATAGACKALAHRAVMSGEVLRLKPGLYCLAERYRRATPHPFVLASVLSSPSHISFESALWHHDLIPEAVREIASATPLRSRTFHTPLGDFSYTRVPARDPRAGVRAVRVGVGAWAFVATPLRAIADVVYCRRAITWERDGVRFLCESLRIEHEDLAEMPFDDADDIINSIRDARTVNYVRGLQRELAR